MTNVNVNQQPESWIESIKEILDYDPQTGVFTWKVYRNYRTGKGDIAGSLHYSGYIQIKIDGTLYPAHRLAWAYVYGKFPPDYIDHIDFDKSNNRITNLRLADEYESSQHRRQYGHRLSKGVAKCANSNKYQWRISFYGKLITGTEDTLEQTIATRKRIARILHGEFFHE